MGGQVSGDGDQPDSDINGINGGFSQYTRLLYNLNVVTTDEAVIGWNDGNLHTLHKMTWDASNEFIAAMYYRVYTEIAFCNEFLRNVTDEKLAENAQRLGEIFRREMNRIIGQTELVVKVRGKGLLNAIIVNDTPESSTAWDLCMKLAENGLLAKPTHGNIIRFAPPLVMTEEQLMECVAIIEETIMNFKK